MKKASEGQTPESDCNWDEFAAFNKALRQKSRTEKIRYLRKNFPELRPQTAVRDFVIIVNRKIESLPPVLIFHLPTMLWRGYCMTDEQYKSCLARFKDHPEDDKELVESIVLLRGGSTNDVPR
jgi:hypothetical protein